MRILVRLLAPPGAMTWERRESLKLMPGLAGGDSTRGLNVCLFDESELLLWTLYSDLADLQKQSRVIPLRKAFCDSAYLGKQ